MEVFTAISGIGAAVAAVAAVYAIILTTRFARHGVRDRRLEAIGEKVIQLPRAQSIRNASGDVHTFAELRHGIRLDTSGLDEETRSQIPAVFEVIDPGDLNPTPEKYAMAMAEITTLRAKLQD